MSFLIDPPLLFLSGLFIYFGGRRLSWGRHAKIVVGLGIALVFIIFSSLLYADMIRCVFPFFSGMKGSEFMLHTNLTGITKADVPLEAVVVLFLLYPLWIFAGYAFTLTASKRLRTSKEVFSYSDVKSHRVKIDPSEYAVVRGEDTGKCVEDAIGSLGGIRKFVKKGDKVMIKVNICGGVPENEGSFTSTKVVQKLVDLVRMAGGVPTIVDADMVWTKFGPAARDSGWEDWARSYKVRLENLIYTRIVRFDFGKESPLGVERVSKEMIDADVIISVPTMKTHLLTGVTLGMKNMYGTFPEIDKAKFHRMGIEEVVYYINKAFTPNLVVIDGSIGGEAIGPLSCHPIYFNTIIASNDVVTADAVACKLMGYEPTDIIHVKTARDRGLGNIPKEYNFDNLKAHPKDGKWARPDPKVKDFYEWAIELLLKFPGWETLFNIGADFILYDTARLPVLRYFTPAVLQLLSDCVYLNLKGQKCTAEARKRRMINASVVLLVALISLLGFCLNGFLWRSPFFDANYLVAIAVSVLTSLRMKTRQLVTLVATSGLVAFALERAITSTGVLTYQGQEPYPFLFVIPGWIIMMISILGLTDLLRAWLVRLRIFQALSKWRALPTLAISLVFAAFFIWEGYLSIGKIPVLLVYLGMILLGFTYSSRCPIEWNASLAIVSIALGGYMELAGSMAGFWRYHYLETLPVFIAIAWALNAWAAHGIASLGGVDMSRSMSAKLKLSMQPSAEASIQQVPRGTIEARDSSQ